MATLASRSHAVTALAFGAFCALFCAARPSAGIPRPHLLWVLQGPDKEARSAPRA